jgi:hypothetical protein
MSNERHHNPPVERQGPDRSGSVGQATAGPDGSAPTHSTAHGQTSAAREGVRVGYDIIDRHTREGREEAWQRSRATSESGTGQAPGFGPPGGAWPGTPWAMPALGALLGPWLQLLQVPARMFEAGLGARATPTPTPTGSWGPFTSGVSRPPPGEPASSTSSSTEAQTWAHGSYTPPTDSSGSGHAASPSTQKTTPGSLRTLSVRMTSSRPTQVDVALPSLPSDTEVQVMALAPVGGEHAPLPAVSLHHEPDRIVVGIVIPDEQPPGRYAGAVLRADGTALGSISVDVSDP